MLKAEVASFSLSGSGPPPPNWDVLFQTDTGRPYDLLRALSVLHPSDAVAVAQSMTDAERVAHATNQPSTTIVGNRLTVWAEPVPGHGR